MAAHTWTRTYTAAQEQAFLDSLATRLRGKTMDDIIYAMIDDRIGQAVDAVKFAQSIRDSELVAANALVSTLTVHAQESEAKASMLQSKVEELQGKLDALDVVSDIAIPATPIGKVIA